MKFDWKVLGAALVVGAMTASPASAAMVLFQGLGMFSSSATTTDYSAPNESFTFSFDLPNPYTSSGSGPFGTNETRQATNFTYTLEGVTQNLSLTGVDFGTGSQIVDVALRFGSTEGLVLFGGADVGSSGTLSSPSFNTYQVGQEVISGGSASFVGQRGSAALTLTNAPVSAVPLPPAVLLFGTALLAFGGLGYAVRRGKGRNFSAATPA